MTKAHNPQLGQTEHSITNCKSFKERCCYVILQLIFFFYFKITNKKTNVKEQLRKYTSKAPHAI